MIELISVFLNGEHGPILNDFELKLRAGEVVSLVGTSGGGKSMVLRVASGALRLFLHPLFPSHLGPKTGAVSLGSVLMDLAESHDKPCRLEHLMSRQQAICPSPQRGRRFRTHRAVSYFTTFDVQKSWYGHHAMLASH